MNTTKIVQKNNDGHTSVISDHALIDSNLQEKPSTNNENPYAQKSKLSCDSSYDGNNFEAANEYEKET